MYDYKISNSLGQYLGLLQNVTSDFNYNQNIGTSFAQVEITVGQSADTAGLPVSPLLDVTGNNILDETGNQITDDGVGDIVGSNNPSNLIQNNNQIQIIEYSQWNPNGVVVFSGYISKWKATFGSKDDIVITCISNGQDLNNYLVPGESSADQSQTQIDAYVQIQESQKIGSFRVGQTFTVGSGITSVSGIQVWLGMNGSPEQITLKLWSSLADAGVGTSPLATATGQITTNVMTGVTFTFQTPVTVTPNTQYFFTVQATDAFGANIYFKQSDVYAGGTMYYSTGGTYTNAGYATYDLAFYTYFISTSVAVPYAGFDVTGVLNTIMANYISAGGGVRVPKPVINQKFQYNFYDTQYTNGTKVTYYGQTFTPSQDTEVDLIQLYMGINVAGPATYTISLVQGDPTQDVLNYNGVATVNIGGSNVFLANNVTGSVNNPGVVSFLIPQNAQNQNIVLKKGVQYYVLVGLGVSGSTITQMFGSTGAPTDSQIGPLYTASLSANGTANPTKNSNHYLYMNIGLISPYPQSTSLFSAYAWTFNSITYTFKLQTMQQAIQKLLELAPADWYWYVDPATNILYFSEEGTTADFTLIKDRHLSELDIEATKENIKNVAYWTGGDDGTGSKNNILVIQKSPLGNNRVGLGLLSDSNVNSTNGGKITGSLLAQEYLNENASETYITNVTVLNSTIDTSQIKLGNIIGFAGFGNFVDQLLLPVVGINRTPDYVTLQLGSLPPRPTRAIALIQNQLNNLQNASASTTAS